jgi:hypothetical protein
MSSTWIDATMRAALEAKRRELRAQLAEVEALLDGNGKSLPAARKPKAVVRAARKPLSAEAKQRLSDQMKAKWAARKAADLPTSA